MKTALKKILKFTFVYISLVSTSILFTPAIIAALVVIIGPVLIPLAIDNDLI